MAEKSKKSGKVLNKRQVAIVGIGRVGLPLALFLAEKGYKVYGLDVDKEKINLIAEGKMPFMEEGGPTVLKKYVNRSFFPSTDFSNIAKSGIIILTLGTPVDENMNPSLTQIDKAIEQCRPYFKGNQLLILRSTVSPGTTNYVKSYLNDLGNIQVGTNLFLAFCPERIAEGKSLTELAQIPQIVGGVDRVSTQKASEFFEDLGIVVNRSDDVSAELAKLFTNMYRYINFAIANEFMILAGNYNRDIYKIVDLVNKNYKRGGLALPGLTGGPCLFKDGFFLIGDVPFADLIATSWKINESVPLFLIKQVANRRKLEGKKAVILGLAFKAEIDDIRESLAFKVKKALERERAKVFLHDPYVQGYENDLDKTLKDADFIFLATNHNYYKKMDITKMKSIVSKNCVICDVWNVFKTNKIIFTIKSLQIHFNKRNDKNLGDVFETKWRDL
ncbi:MAG: UDP-glucose/GDP-mannose dehydrogenase [Parcubacteria group bacterium GW2011_GWA1_36_12]|nr:MAG: UDP-glucose/GDP-mannose dehydrogenase [Parcubacteria group bacterium GW2011_GWA1_36_12]